MSHSGSVASQATARDAARCRFLGITVYLITAEELTAFIVDAVAHRQKCIIANHNLHSLYLIRRSPAMRAFCDEARMTHVDGMGIVWIGRVLGCPLRARHRVNCSELLERLLPVCASSGARVMLLGAQPGVSERAAGHLRRQYAGLEVHVHHGYFSRGHDDEENSAVLRMIANRRIDILIVGMGMPEQERWIVENFSAIAATVVLNGGGIIDLLAGVLPTPPRWVGRVGLEWLYRLLTAPKRVWFRYLVEPWFVLVAVVGEVLRRAARIGR
ncbi:MAG TPA: WecB/TagA/CpsF family glycosyltransferase [Gemmatimonadaceae bacterium]